MKATAEWQDPLPHLAFGLVQLDKVVKGIFARLPVHECRDCRSGCAREAYYTISELDGG